MSERKPLVVESLEAVFRRVHLPVGLTLDELRIEGARSECTFEPFRIFLDRPGDLQITLTEESVARFLNEQAPGGLKDFSVKLAGGKVTVKATARVILEIRATAVCTLRIVEGKCLYVDLESVDALGGAAKGLVENQLAKINPILDARQFPLDAVLTRIEIAEGQLDIFGTISPLYGPTYGP
jgi:hypothetical protein